MNISAQPLTSPVLARSNPHGQHKPLSHSVEVQTQYLRLPHLESAKINNLSHLPSPASPTYALPVQTHAGLILADHDSLAHIPRLNAVFLCVLSAYARFMVGLKGDTFEYASYLTDWSANPLQSYHLNHLAVTGKTSISSLGVTP